MESLFIVMPAYNEEANIEQVIQGWYPLLQGKAPSSRLVVADSGSTDRTHFLLRQMQQTHEQLCILKTSDHRHGPKLMALYQYAISKGADYIFQTDSDGQTSPDDFAGFWKMRHQYEGIFGWRIDRKDGRFREWVEKVVCLLLRLIFHIKVPDANAPFRLMQASALKRHLPFLTKRQALPNIMLTALFLYNKERTAFHVISFFPRAGGKNSIHLRQIWKLGCVSLLDFIKLRQKL